MLTVNDKGDLAPEGPDAYTMSVEEAAVFLSPYMGRALDVYNRLDDALCEIGDELPEMPASAYIVGALLLYARACNLVQEPLFMYDNTGPLARAAVELAGWTLPELQALMRED